MRFLSILLLFVYLKATTPFIEEPLVYIDKTSCAKLLNTRDPSSQINVYIPSIPYSYVSRLVNGTLLRVKDNEEGLEYMLAKEIKQIDDLTYDVFLKKGIKFQDGTNFNADSVVHNFKHFIAHPFTYTNIHNSLIEVKKLDEFSVRFFLNSPYGMFLNDLASINIYSDEYLEKFSWMGGATGDSMIEPGPYGLGPYILKEGFATGRKQTNEIILEANPYYYEEGKPYINSIKIFTEISSNEALRRVLGENPTLDIAPIPFNKKIETVLSSESKLITIPSMHNYTIYFNMINPNSLFAKEEYRKAVVKAIDQDNLLNFVYKKEGKLSPSAASANFTAIAKLKSSLKPQSYSLSKEEKNELFTLLNGTTFKVLTQDRFMFLWKGIEYQLKEYGVSLDYTITKSEKVIYENLLTNHDNPKDWDILTWGNDDWYGNHPWTLFFTYNEGSEWSMIRDDPIMKELIAEFFRVKTGSPKYDELVKKIVLHASKKAYLLPVPSPNLVLAVNKEVSYTPSSSAIMPLWDAKISSLHRSVRKGGYPNECKKPFLPIRLKDE